MTGRVANDESIWIWPFELTEKIGEGGMAAVYRARYVKDDRQVAVKLLPEETGEKSAALARFQREMEVLKKLRHPNVVRCFGGVCENKQPFYAMELVEGGTLDDLLRKVGKRTWRTTAECGLQMCAGLACAHSHGIVHRDVKPSNFLIDGDTFKLSDFGLALMASSTKLTATGKTVGTFDYMAPEQIAGKEVSARTDLYALGVVFFEMLTGRPPFEAEERVAILHQHLGNRPPLVTDFAVDCPPDLERLVDDMLEKQPDDRPRDAEEVAGRLRSILAGERVVVPPKPQRERVTSARAGTVAANIPPPTPVPIPREVRPVEAGDEATRLSWLAYGLTALACLLGILLWRAGDRTPVAREAVESLVESTRTEAMLEVRVEAVRHLGPLAARSGAALERLDALLADEDPAIRAVAARAIGAAGPEGRELMSNIMRLERQDTEPRVRIAAAEAGRMLKEAPSASNPWWLRGLGLLVFVAGVVAFVQWPRWGRTSEG